MELDSLGAAWPSPYPALPGTHTAGAGVLASSMPPSSLWVKTSVVFSEPSAGGLQFLVPGGREGVWYEDW